MTTSHADEDEEIQSLELAGLSGSIATLKKSLAIKKKKLTMQLPHDSLISLLGIYSRNKKYIFSHENLDTSVDSSFVCNSRKLEKAQMCFIGERSTAVTRSSTQQ